MFLRLPLAFVFGLALAGCATPPPAPPPEPPKPVEPVACVPSPAPVCPAPVIPPPPPPPEPEYRGRLQPVPWADIAEWGKQPMAESLAAFLRGCPVLEKRSAEWKTACAAGAALGPAPAERDVKAYFERHFDPHQAVNADETVTGMVTGYYEPLLRGNRTRTPKYRYPLYAAPPDLLTVDLSSLHPELKNRRLRGRVDGNKVVPYFSRGDIDGEGTPLKGHELAWVDDAVEVFFLHIQGSGQVELPDGERLRFGYADQNGHPFKGLGRLLVQRGELKLENASMQGIKEWARRNPKKVREFLDANPSYVFFRELPKDLSGPIGSLGVPITGERSVAVDARVVPLGAPLFLSTTFPNSPQPLHRLMVAQDTGGAINGGVRVDFYWGFGDAAGNQAGKMKQDGRVWVLLPKGLAAPPGRPAKP